MIKSRDLVRRVYEDTQLKRFEVLFELNNEEETVFFKKLDERTWQVSTTLFVRTSRLVFEVPKTDIRLELVAAMGLHLLKQEIEDEVYYLNNFNELLKIAVSGM